MEFVFLYAPLAGAAAFGYLLGSIPFGFIISKLFGIGDIRAVGSGNIGATNVLRTGHKGAALATLLLDAGKGFAAVLLAAGFTPLLGFFAGIGAVLGHCFPVWLKFKGGRGVATGFGVLFAACPIAGVLACATWGVVALIFRISSLAAIVAYILAPIYAGLLDGVLAAGFTAVISIIVILKHRANIVRLFAGTEPKIGQSL